MTHNLDGWKGGRREEYHSSNSTSNNGIFVHPDISTRFRVEVEHAKAIGWRTRGGTDEKNENRVPYCHRSRCNWAPPSHLEDYQTHRDTDIFLLLLETVVELLLSFKETDTDPHIPTRSPVTIHH